jgi:hypothetical protein
MGNSSQKINQHPQFKNLPPELRNHLKKFKNNGYISDDILPDIQKSLLDAINKQELSSGYSPIYPDRINYDENELIVWLGVNFPVFIRKEPKSIFEPDKKISKQICLVCFNEYKRYDFIWEHDIEDKIKDRDNLTTITDYKDMLPLVKSFNKTMQQNNGELPYLGEKNDQGDWVLLDKKIWRPEYEKINNEQPISIENCICILLGIDDFDLIVSIDNHLDLITEEQERYSWKDDFYILPFAHADDPFRDVIVTAKYREAWRDVISYIKDFVKKIIRASEAGIIEVANYSTLMGDHVSLRDIKTHQYNFKTLSFLKWAEEAGYAIPDELLPLIENADGTLQWFDAESINKSDTGNNTEPTKESDKCDNDTNQKISKQSSDSTDKNSRKFVKKGSQWQVVFDGEFIFIKHNKPLRYILEVLKLEHGQPIGYVKLGQLVEGTYIDNKTKKYGDLEIEVSGKKFTDKDKQQMRDSLAKFYKKYRTAPDKHNDDWELSKKIAKDEYGILTNEDGEELTFGESKWQKEINPAFKRAEKTVSSNKNLFLKMFSDLSELSEHFNTYLNSDKGSLVYTPPKGSKQWEIIDK